MTVEQTLSAYRSDLRELAARMVGCMHDAEDIVQDTFLKYLTIDHSQIKDTKSYLYRSVTNNCLNHIKNLKRLKTEYLEGLRSGQFLERLDLSHLDISAELNSALFTLQQKLKPLEKAVFILREVFELEYEEIQVLFDKNVAYCRKLVSRAKQKLSGEQTHVSVATDKHADLVHSFRKACSFGPLEDLISHLQERVHLK